MNILIVLLGFAILQLFFVIFLLWIIGTRQYEINKDRFTDRRKR